MFDAKGFGERVRTCRMEADLSQRALAERADISVAFLGHIERGTRMASVPTLCALAEALHVSEEYLLHGTVRIDGVGMSESQMMFLKEITESGDRWLRK